MGKFDKSRRFIIEKQMADIADLIAKAESAGMEDLAEKLHAKYRRLARRM